MKQYLALTPDISDPLVVHFARYIGLLAEIRMPAIVPKPAPYLDDLKLLEVPRRPHPNARVKFCWLNCRDYVQSNPGSDIVFGWQVERMHHNHVNYGYGAFHHAVIRQNNALVDITPFAVANEAPTVLFVPDSRVPYDYEDLRTPMSLFWSLHPSMQPFWTSDTEYPNEHRVASYGVGKPPRINDKS